MEVAQISTHAPRTGSDYSRVRQASPAQRFQPTLPARGATIPGGAVYPRRKDFNPRSPHGERLQRGEVRPVTGQFQPTLPARGATRIAWNSKTARSYFNPRSPHGERHQHTARQKKWRVISTHAPRTGSDHHGRNRHPRREFQPTLPARGATCTRFMWAMLFSPFQPTLPARGATRTRWGCSPARRHFNPRSPHGERRSTSPTTAWFQRFQPTLPARGATAFRARLRLQPCNFNPRSPHGERRIKS